MYPLLLLIIMGILRSRYGYRETGRFCDNSRAYPVARFGFKNRKVPSHVSIRTFIRPVDFKSVQKAFHQWTRDCVSIESGEWIAIDGKSIRSTVSGYSNGYQNFVSPVSLFCSKREQVLHVEKMENRKENEGQTVENMLEILDLKDVVFTMVPCTVKKTLEKIVQSGNHYPVKVKGNQPKLKAVAGETVINSNPVSFHRDEKIAGGRLEIGETCLYNRPNNPDGGWESIRLIVYVSDLQTDDARLIAEGIRSHWYIENRLHYTKDAVMREDAASTANKPAAANLALLRDFAFNILKTKNRSIKQATEIFENCNLKELWKILCRT